MAFLKFSRDKRGYENYYLFEPPSSGRHNVHGKGRPRLLFWFRTPPQVKLGRLPFSDEVQKMVEAQNPGVSFDWARIIATPIPPPEIDHWRERRRAEKAAKRAAKEAEASEVEEAEADAPPAAAADSAVAGGAVADGASAESAAVEATGEPEAEGEAEGDLQAETAVAASDPQGNASPGHRGRRRRRRGGRGRPGPQGPPETPPTNEV